MSKLMVVKVVLKTKKEVLLRQMQISDQETAIAMAANRTQSDNKFVLSSATNLELIKLLLTQIDGKEVTPAQKEDLNSLFTIGEYGQILQVIDHISEGKAELGKDFKIEMVAPSKAQG